MSFEKIINEAWDQKETITKASHPEVVTAIKNTIDQVDKGTIRDQEGRQDLGLARGHADRGLFGLGS